MTPQERDNLNRLYRIAESVPFPIMGGSATGSISGFVGYAKDMKIFVPKFKNCLLALGFSNTPEALEDVLEMTTFSENIEDLEKWVSERQADCWGKS